MLKLNNKLALILILILSLAIAACSDDDTNPTQPPETLPTESLVRVIHSSYDAPAVDVWVDGEVAISNLAYGESSGYAAVPAGTRNIKVSPAGATSPIVIDVDLPIASETEYTVVATDQLSNLTPIFDVDDRSPNSSKAITSDFSTHDAR